MTLLAFHQLGQRQDLCRISVPSRCSCSCRRIVISKRLPSEARPGKGAPADMREPAV